MLMGLCEAKTADGAAENVGAFIQKSALHFFRISISEMMILLKTKWTEMSNRISALTTEWRTKMFITQLLRRCASVVTMF